MRYRELFENNEPTDDELFGPGAMTLGLTPQQCQAVAQTLVSCRKHFERDPEFEEILEDDPEEFNLILRDFNRAAMAMKQCDPLSALAALETNPINYDLDDWAWQVVGKKTGIHMADLVNMDNPAQEAAFERAKKDMRAAHTRYDSIVGESDEPSDAELFGAEHAMSGPKRFIYTAGRKILLKLQYAWQNPAIQREYNEYDFVNDADAKFDQVVRIAKLPFRQVFIVDTVMREFTAQEGLNDYGRMIDQGEFNDLVDAWQRFAEDQDIEHEDWFQREVKEFTGGLR